MRQILIVLLVCLAGGLTAQSYVGSHASQAYSNTPLSNPTVMAMAVDTISAVQAPAGFAFNFFGQTCDRFRVGSNGYITLGNASNPPSAVVGSNPDVSSGLVVAALWLDLAAGDVLSKYTPASGGGPGVLVVRWGPVWTRTLPPASGPFQSAPGAVLFEMKLDTATGIIKFRYGYPNWHSPENTGNIHSQCIAGPAGSGQEIICQPVSSMFTADGEMTKYPVDLEITFTPTVPALAVDDGANVAYGATAAGSMRDFGGQDINAGPTNARTIKLLNTGTGTLALSGISVAPGTHSALFTVDTSSTAATVAPGAFTTFTVAFDPDTVGAKSAQIEITHNDSSQPIPFVFEVAGTGMPTSLFPVVTVREDNAAGAWIGNGAAASGNRDFGSHLIGTMPTGPAVIYIENTGAATLTLGTVSCLSPDFVLDASGVPASLAPGAWATFEVRFNAQSTGVKAAAITFGHNDSTTVDPFTINVTGVAAGAGQTSSGSGNSSGGSGGCAALAHSGGLWLLVMPAIICLRRKRGSRAATR
ncbi:MAG: choice-of-anchor D domain-containing protein [Planctomycetes bacterium]|nr:choice-of-anchor D domain-containing protein [Planctomycetota bacterium]